MIVISIHVPHAGHDICHFDINFGCISISIHVPHAGHDCVKPRKPAQPIFQSTCPMRGTTFIDHQSPPPFHFNPRAPCGARPSGSFGLKNASSFQSTCPMRGTTVTQTKKAVKVTFQSTCPMRGMTCYGASRSGRWADFNPRAPCGARHSPQG